MLSIELPTKRHTFTLHVAAKPRPFGSRALAGGVARRHGFAQNLLWAQTWTNPGGGVLGARAAASWHAFEPPAELAALVADHPTSLASCSNRLAPTWIAHLNGKLVVQLISQRRFGAGRVRGVSN